MARVLQKTKAVLTSSCLMENQRYLLVCVAQVVFSPKEL